MIRIWPRGGTTSATSLTVTIDWCADQYGWNPTTQKVFLNNVEVTSDFTTTTYESYPGCVYQEKWIATIALRRGSNQLRAEANGMNPNYPIPAQGYDAVLFSTPTAARTVGKSCSEVCAIGFENYARTGRGMKPYYPWPPSP
jgi:hypothetical protein